MNGDLYIEPERVLRWLQAMIKINSVNPILAEGGVGERDLAAWLAEICRELGYDVQMQESAPDRPNVIAYRQGMGGGRSIMLTGHTDTVSAEGMTIDPFDPRYDEVSGFVYGRGAVDMKGGLASILGAASALSDVDLAGDVYLAFVTDEEYASVGAETLIKTLQPDATILTEPTGGEICIAHKGFAWLTFITEGIAAHGSLYDEGVDAITHMGGVLALIDQLNGKTFPQHVHPLLGRASIHASTISGGLGLSTYPDRCTLQIEQRLLPHTTQAELEKLWTGLLNELQAQRIGFQGRFEIDLMRPGYEIAPDAPIVQTLDESFRQVTGRNSQHTGMAAWLDSAVFAQAAIPTVIYGPKGAGMHAAVEYVEFDSVITCARVIADAVRAWCE